MQTNVNTPPKPFSMGNQPRTVYSGGHDHTIKVAENQALLKPVRDYGVAAAIETLREASQAYMQEAAQPIQPQQAE